LSRGQASRRAALPITAARELADFYIND